MLCALTKPLFEAETDFGLIAPLIVFRRTIFVGSVVALAGFIRVVRINIAENNKLTLLVFIESEFTVEI
jgi:hypothetical protein